jgi:hypothetical protein
LGKHFASGTLFLSLTANREALIFRWLQRRVV